MQREREARKGGQMKAEALGPSIAMAAAALGSATEHDRRSPHFYRPRRQSRATGPAALPYLWRLR